MSTVEYWFNKAFEEGRKVQIIEHNKEEVDGRAIWGAVENEIKDIKLTELNLHYNSALREIYKKMDLIISKYDMDKNEMNPKSNHFFLQLKNLVEKKSQFIIQLNRVAQLGFNAGQLSVFIEKDTLPKDRKVEIAEFVGRHKMFDLDTYVCEENIKIINKYLKANLKTTQNGGYFNQNNYYHNYIKYKTKYLNLKNKLYI
jgi:hypothetical protein